MHLLEIDFYQNILCRGCNSNKSPLVNSNGSAPGRRQGHVEFRMIRRPLWFYRSRVRDFLFTQISGHSPIKNLEVLNISELEDFCIYWCQSYMPLTHMRSKSPVTKFGQQKFCRVCLERTVFCICIRISFPFPSFSDHSISLIFRTTCTVLGQLDRGGVPLYIVGRAGKTAPIYFGKSNLQF